jgi:glycosyltransferase involved in cell wall biosynthesis
MARTRVIHIITRFDKGGSAENTFLTVKGLDKETYDVTLIKGSTVESLMGEEERSAVDRNLTEAENAGIKIITIESLVRNVHPLRDLFSFRALICIFLKERPHIVHTHTSKAGILGRWAAWISNVPVIVHTPHGHVFRGYFNRWISLFYVLLERWTARITSKIIALTEQEKKDHLFFRIAPANKFEVIHSGVDLDKFYRLHLDPVRVKKDLGIPGHAFVVGTVGRLAPIKGHRYLIEAAKYVVQKFPETRFIFLGDGELLDEFRSLVVGLGIEDNFLFLGWRSNVAEILSIFDIFVFPSLNEGMGKAVVEAMSLGKPIIASSVGGLKDLISDGRNGILIPQADSTILSIEIAALLSDPTKRERIAREGKRMSQQYNSEIMVEKIEQLYKSLMVPLKTAS